MRVLKQCKSCPWIKGADLSKIENYSREQHEALIETIANDDPLRITPHMACHYSTDEKNFDCVGWLNNQLKCNNLPLRISFLKNPC